LLSEDHASAKQSASNLARWPRFATFLESPMRDARLLIGWPSGAAIPQAILQARVPLSFAGRTNSEPFGAMFVAPAGVPY
jgi:hypothetical protein